MSAVAEAAGYILSRESHLQMGHCYSLKSEYREGLPAVCRRFKGDWFPNEKVWRFPATINSSELLDEIRRIFADDSTIPRRRGGRRGGKSTPPPEPTTLPEVLTAIGCARQELIAIEERIDKLEKIASKLA
jgi:hypothetical protein